MATVLVLLLFSPRLPFARSASIVAEGERFSLTEEYHGEGPTHYSPQFVREEIVRRAGCEGPVQGYPVVRAVLARRPKAQEQGRKAEIVAYAFVARS